MQKFDQHFGIDNFLLKCSNVKGLDTKMSICFETCVKEWCFVCTKQDVLTNDNVLDQYICGNCQIKKKGVSIFYPNWMKSNYVRIRDIWDDQTRNWKTGHEIYAGLIVKNN